MTELGHAERVEADDGYVGEHPRYIKCPNGFANKEETEFMQQRVRNRQETINMRLKYWGVLRQMFRHTEYMHRHGDLLRAILIILQIAINLGEKLFQCGYKDPPYDNDNSNDDNGGSESNGDDGEQSGGDDNGDNDGSESSGDDFDFDIDGNNSVDMEDL